MNKKPVALITGAGRGIGRGIALELAREGFDLAGCDIIFEPGDKTSGLFEVQKTIRKLGGEFLPVEGDVASLEDHGRILEAALDRFGRLDFLVNNAGVAPQVRLDVLETTPESFDRVFAVNVRGAFFLTQRAAKIMLAGMKKRTKTTPMIVFVSSISAVVSSTSRAEYCLSKSALSMAAKIFADRLAASGIPVYEIRPGLIRTDMTAPVREKYDALIAAGLVPQRRWGFPEDVGKAVAALARGYFPYSTGLVLDISGGLNIQRL